MDLPSYSTGLTELSADEAAVLDWFSVSTSVVHSVSDILRIWSLCLPSFVVS